MRMVRAGARHDQRKIDACRHFCSLPQSPPHLLSSNCFMNMNWTGGSLQRTKHANKGITQKQKAYFARARTHHQEGSKSPAVSFRPSFLGVDSSFESRGHVPSYWLGSVHTRHSGRQRHAPAQPVDSTDDHALYTENRTTAVLSAASPEPLRGGTFALKQAERGPAGILVFPSGRLLATVDTTESADVLMLLQMHGRQSEEQTVPMQGQKF
jgi:hypothetical protein